MKNITHKNPISKTLKSKNANFKNSTQKSHTSKLHVKPAKMPTITKVVLFNKPFGVHSQFKKDTDSMRTLADFFDDKSLRVAGRLDADSEGLLVLTNNGQLIHKITTPAKTHQKISPKTYLVQVEGVITDEQLSKLQTGVILKDGKTLPAIAKRLSDEALPIKLWVRNPPIRERKSIPTSWLSLTIFEGKNRQVRRMTASVGLPCLRLIRYGVACFALDDLQQGCSKILILSKKDLQAFGITV